MAALSWNIWGAMFTARQKAGGSQISHRYSQGMLGRVGKTNCPSVIQRRGARSSGGSFSLLWVVVGSLKGQLEEEKKSINYSNLSEQEHHQHRSKLGAISPPAARPKHGNFEYLNDIIVKSFNANQTSLSLFVLKKSLSFFCWVRLFL